MRGVRTIKSRASVRSRERHGRLPAVVGVPPVKVYDPEISDGMYGNGYPVYNLYKTAPNLTIKAWVGQWDDTDGETVLTSDFYTEYDEPLGATPTLIEGQLPGIELTITEAHIGKYIHVKTFASRGGVTTENVSQSIVVVQPVADTPEIGGGATPSPSIVGVNQPVGKPDYKWTAGALITPTTIVGEWYRNEQPTGVTGDLFPDPEAENPLGRETVEGDLIRWQETCTNAAGISKTSPTGLESGLNYSSWQTLVTDLLPAFRASMRSEIASRITGLPGGMQNMNVFDVTDYTGKQFTFNENNWAADLRYQLSAHCAFHQGWYQPQSRYGYFLITPRHILTCLHSGRVGDNDQRDVYFLTHDNRMVKGRTIASSDSVRDGDGVFGDDQILLLDTNMVEAGCHALPILSPGLQHTYRFYSNMESDRIPLLGVSQSSYNNSPTAWSRDNDSLGITRPHKRMLFIKLPRSFYPGFISRPPEYNGYHYQPYSGDSGGPIMALAYGKFFVVGQHYDGSMISSSVISPARNAHIAMLIAAADARAVALGRLSEPTGLLPDFVSLEDAEAYPVPRPPEARPLIVSDSDPSALFVSEADPTPIFIPPYA